MTALSLISLLFIGCSNQHSPDADAQPPDGQALYTKYCTSCHQEDGRGMNGTMAGNFVDNKALLNKSDEELINSITNGYRGNVGAMPAWGAILSEEQIAAALAYIRIAYGEPIETL